MKKKARTKSGASLGKAVLFGIAISIAVFLIFSLLASLVTVALQDPLKWIRLIFAITFFASSAVSAIIVSVRYRPFGIYPSFLCSLTVTLVLFTVALIINANGTSLLLIASYGAYILISVLSSYLTIGKLAKRRRHR